MWPLQRSVAAEIDLFKRDGTPRCSPPSHVFCARSRSDAGTHDYSETLKG